MILNTRIFEFDSKVLTELPDEVTHFRGFSPDFSAPKINGLYQYTAETKPARFNDWLTYCITNDISVVWTLNMTKDRTMEKELSFVSQLIDQGLNITHFQLGGEFWLGKYYFGKTDEKGVVEQVRIADYLQMLDEWIPALRISFPDVQLMLLGCSHQNGTNQTETYRKMWNNAVIDYKGANDANDTLGFTVHYYAGAKPDLQPSNGEEAIFNGINWEPFISQLRTPFPDVDIIVPESGWYPSDKSQEQLDMMTEFYEKGVEAIGDNGIMGLHVLNQRNESFHNWYDRDGLTDVGDNWLDYFSLQTPPEEEEEEVVLEKVFPDRKGQWVMYGFTYLTFSDGTEKRIVTRWGNIPIGREDIGKTLDELKNNV
jgi:hypothetical protein